MREAGTAIRMDTPLCPMYNSAAGLFVLTVHASSPIRVRLWDAGSGRDAMAALFLAILIAPLPLMLLMATKGLLSAQKPAPAARRDYCNLKLPRSNHF